MVLWYGSVSPIGLGHSASAPKHHSYYFS